MFLYTLSMFFNSCNSDVVKWRILGKCHIEIPWGGGKGGCISTRSNVCLRALWIVISKPILIINRLLHYLKEMLQFTTRLQCSRKPFKIMCCHHRRAREANIDISYIFRVTQFFLCICNKKKESWHFIHFPWHPIGTHYQFWRCIFLSKTVLAGISENKEDYRYAES